MKTKLGFLGAGGIATAMHLPAFAKLSDRCEIAVIADIDPTKAQDAAEKFGAKAETSLEAMLTIVDAVVVTTPNAFHHGPTLSALRAGKHVLCEKPLAMNGDEAREMCALAREAGKVLQVGLQLRQNAPAQFLRRFVENGHMGEVQYARAQAIRRRGVPGWGVFIDKEKQGGGPLIDIGVHILDLTLFIMGHPKPVSATGMTWDSLAKNPATTNFWGSFDAAKFTVEDFAVGMIRFDNGAVVTLESSFMANAEGDPFTAQFYGTGAGAILKNSGDDPVRIFKEIDGQYFNMTPPVLPSVTGGHDGQAIAFLNSIQQGAPVAVPGEHGMMLNAIFDALYRSAETRREEPIFTDF